MRNFIFLLIGLPVLSFADYRSSAEFLFDSTCYVHYMNLEVEKAIKGEGVRDGYDGLLLLPKAKLYIERAKNERTIRYNSSVYKRRTGKKFNSSTCLPYKKLVAKGMKLEVYELYLMEFANNFGQ